MNGNWTWEQFLANLRQYRQDGTITIPKGKGDSPDPAVVPEDKRQVSAAMRVLHKGCRGKDVKIWQTICGVNPDGDFGSRTHNATLEYQRTHDLAVDGYVGPATWSSGLSSLA
jgi:peptidoglycan hydrolase-like protein with peptidoglycan-binding domain